PVLLQGFRVWPNVVADAAQVRIALPSPMQQVRLDVFDMNGKKVTTLFEGRLPAGTHPFELSRRQFPAAGKYTLRLMAGNRIASQPVMVF
ncbi:MAG: T9SS type A sorting domain-containing protein, partial [Haliscomenobacter sp.]|nr:T9SS type A sorting domain-containing protein [Haliscomenobacter sp.]